MANANLTWETTYSHNLGLDFGFWRNRLSGSVEVYQNTTEDILMRYPVSGSGYSFQYRNAGTIRNRGLEVSVAAVLAEKAKWGVNFNANIAFNRSRIMDLAGLETYSQSSGWNNNVTDYYAVLGGAIGDIRGYDIGPLRGRGPRPGRLQPDGQMADARRLELRRRGRRHAPRLAQTALR